MSEFGVAQGQTFTAVELVAGLDVMRLVAESRLGGPGLASGGALALISQAARAVGYAHGRGLSHLGLSPTNVIVTAEGDVKVTDFGILAATISTKPVDTPRLAQRIGYLAPEQLVGEATSAATDVFVLGVIAYELVTGQRAFFGDSPQQIANAILAGPPADPPLPRPIVRVLSRCLARSQFERFPDARAFADALDAALRVAPVPGTRKDVGAQVKSVLDRHAAMNEGNLSGVVALNLGGPPRPAPANLGPSARLAELDLRRDHDLDLADAPEAVATTEFVRPDVEVARPAPLVGPTRNDDPASTVPDLQKLTTTVPGLVVPPPIPVPPGVAQPMPPPIPMPGSNSTMLGLGSKKPGAQIPSIKAKSQPIPTILPPALKPKAAPVIPAAGGAIPSLRQTQPGQGSAGTKIEPAEVDEFGRPKRSLLGPIPGLGAPGRPRSNNENDAPTLPGTDLVLEQMADGFGGGNDEATRPGQYARSESDFSDLSGDPASTVPDRYVPPMQPKAPLVAKADPTSDDPPTAPHDIGPEIHQRGGLQPFAGVGRQFPDRELTNTSPSIEIIREAGDSVEMPAMREQPITSPPFQRDVPTGQMAPEVVQDLKRASVEEDPLVELALEAHTRGADHLDVPTVAQRKPTGSPVPTPPPVNPNATIFGVGRAGDGPPRTTPPRGNTPPRMPSPTPPSLVPPAFVPAGLAQLNQPVPGTVQSMAPPPPTYRQGPPPQFLLPSQQGSSRKRWPIALGALVVLGAGSGVAAWQLTKSDDGGTTVADGSGSAKKPVGSNGSAKSGSNGSAVVAIGSNGSGSIVKTGSNGSAVALATGSNGSAAIGSNGSNGSKTGSNGSAAIATGSNGSGNGSAAKPTIAPAGNSDSLQIASTPAGARVFIDGADQGVTPVKLAGSADRHTMALSAAGFELYVAEVDGHGAFQVPLKAVTPTGGPAGIKVIKCKDKDRYYVFVDGKPTGMTCPTERIETTVGAHTVEVYDLVTENRRKWDINVVDTRLSYRVRVD
jgi:hypothetical protein